MQPRHLILSSLAVLTIGCSVPSAPGDSGPRNQLQAASQPLEPLAGITFQPLSADNARFASGGGPMAMPASAPMAVVPSPSAVGGPVSGNMYNPMPFGYQYGPGGPNAVPMALVSMSEGTAPGSRGPLNRVLSDVVAPVLKDWAADAHLVSSNATLGNDGLGLDAPTPNPDPIPGKMMMPYGDPGQAGWRLHYVSPSRHETLQFMVASDKTLVIRMRWAPVDLAAAPVMVDSDVAVQKLVSAIEDASFRSVEEESGLDYFLGTAFNVTGGPGMPMPMPMPMPPDYDPGRIEAVYDVPDNARWNANLQTVLGKTVWDLSFYAQPEPMPVPMPSVTPFTPGAEQTPMPMPTPPEFYFENNARGMVDAQTGAVIRFTRPLKRYLPRPSAGAPTPPMKPMPPMPSVMPSA